MTAPSGASSAPQDPVEQKESYSGKKKDHTVKNVLLVNAPLTILFLSETYGGRAHDKRIADATPYPLPAGSRLLQDLGFLAFICNGLQSKWLRTAIIVFLGPNYLPLSISPGPDYLPLSLQSTDGDCNQRYGDHILCNSTPSPFSARPSWR